MFGLCMLLSAGTMSILACGGEHWIGLTERGGLMVRGDNARGQLGIGLRNSEICSFEHVYIYAYIYIHVYLYLCIHINIYMEVYI